MNTCKKIAIIFCYGHLDDIKTPQEQSGIKKYIKSSIEDVTNHNLDCIVLSGGYSDLRFRFSESYTYKKFIENLYNLENVFLEESSLNHSEHIAFTIIQFRNYINSTTHLILYCGHNFYNKTKRLAHELLDNILSYEIKIIEYEDGSCFNNDKFQTEEKLPRELESEKFHILKQLLKSSLINH